MRNLTVIALVIIIGEAALMASHAAAEDRFQKLPGSQIRATLTGLEMTDGVHFSDQFGANGTLTSYSMSRKRIGIRRR